MRYMLLLLERFMGRFKVLGQNIEIDTLLHQDSKGKRDDDTMTLQTEKQETAPGSRLCNLFQKGNYLFQMSIATSVYNMRHIWPWSDIMHQEGVIIRWTVSEVKTASSMLPA